MNAATCNLRHLRTMPCGNLCKGFQSLARGSVQVSFGAGVGAVQTQARSRLRTPRGPGPVPLAFDPFNFASPPDFPIRPGAFSALSVPSASLARAPLARSWRDSERLLSGIAAGPRPRSDHCAPALTEWRGPAGTMATGPEASRIMRTGPVPTQPGAFSSSNQGDGGPGASFCSVKRPSETPV